MTNKLNDQDLNKVSGGKGEAAKAFAVKIDELISDMEIGLSSISKDPNYGPIMQFLVTVRDNLASGTFVNVKDTLKIVMALLSSMSCSNYDHHIIIGEYAHRIHDIVCAI